ncbi:MAG: PAS domain-containing protein [Methanobacterium sp.]
MHKIKASNTELELKEANKRIKSLETKLKRIKNKLDEAESIAHFGLFELDPITLDPTWTNGIFKIVDYNPEYGQIKYIDQKKIIHPDDWDYFYNAIQIVLKTRKDHEINLRIKKADGTIRIVHIIAKPIKDKNNKIITIRGTVQDVTGLKRMEDRFKKSEAFYKTLFENTGTASIIVDENKTILMANTQFENISGYSKEEIEGKKSWKDLVFKEDIEILEKYNHMRMNNNGKPLESYKSRLIDKEGNIKTVLINVAIIHGTKNIIASLTDLTDLKKVEEVLQTTLKRFYTILSNMRASILLVTQENEIEFANQSFCDYFRLNESPDELLGLTASEMIEKIKNSYEYPDEEVSNIQKIVNKGLPVIGEEIYMYGEKVCLRDFIPIFVENKLYGRLWIHLDITERKKIEKELADSERRYRYLVEKATAGMFILNEEGIIKYLNNYMAQILDYSKNEMLESHIKNFVDEDEIFYRTRDSIEGQIEQYNWFKFLSKKEDVFWSNLTIYPIFNSDNKYTGLLGIITDINMQKGLEEAFLEREEMLTDIIYDMMKMLSNVTKDKIKPELNKEDFVYVKNN